MLFELFLKELLLLLANFGSSFILEMNEDDFRISTVLKKGIFFFELIVLFSFFCSPLLLNDEDIKFWDSVELGLILLYLNFDCFFLFFQRPNSFAQTLKEKWVLYWS